MKARCVECGRWHSRGRWRSQRIETCSAACRQRRRWRLDPEFRARRARIMRSYRDRHLPDCRWQKWCWRVVQRRGVLPATRTLLRLWQMHNEKPSTLAALARQAARRAA